MKWRKSVRADVQAELIGHFEDALRDCKNEDEKEIKAKELIQNFGDAKLIADLARRAKKRCRSLWAKIIMRSFQGIGIFIICFVIYCFYIFTGRPTIRINYIQEYIQANRPESKENANAGVLYNKVAKIYVNPPKLSYEKASKENGCGGSSSELLSKIQDIHRLDELNDEEFAALNKWADDNNETIALFLEASKRPYCWYEPEKATAEYDFFIQIPLPHLSAVRNAARLMLAKVRLQAYAGNFDNASQDVFAVWNSAGHFWGPRTIIEQMVGIAIESMSFRTVRDLLSEYNLSQQQLKLLQNQLEKLFAENKCYMNYQTERFFKDDFFQQCFTDNGRGNGHPIPSKLAQFWDMAEDNKRNEESFRNVMFLGMALVSADRKELSQVFDNFYDTAQQYAQMTPWQLRQENKSLNSFSTDWPRLKKARYMNVLKLLPAFDNANSLFHRFNIDGQSLILTLAVLRYQQDNKTLPQTLQQLKDAGYIRSIPIDPFSGKDVIYKVIDNDFTIYSFGQDFDDDGGKMGTNEEAKPSMWNTKDGDAVFWPVKNK
ncbi:MAG: hypothetical protein ACYC3B_05980 [Sedimentisphaerales bacterium]